MYIKARANYVGTEPDIIFLIHYIFAQKYEYNFIRPDIQVSELRQL